MSTMRPLACRRSKKRLCQPFCRSRAAHLNQNPPAAPHVGAPNSKHQPPNKNEQRNAKRSLKNEALSVLYYVANGHFAMGQVGAVPAPEAPPDDYYFGLVFKQRDTMALTGAAHRRARGGLPGFCAFARRGAPGARAPLVNVCMRPVSDALQPPISGGTPAAVWAETLLKPHSKHSHHQRSPFPSKMSIAKTGYFQVRASPGLHL